MDRFVVQADDPQAADVQALLARHLAFAREHSPPEDVHALDLRGLLAEGIAFFSIRQDGRIITFGALKQLDGFHGELKSMHTALEARGRGAGRAMLDHLVLVARNRGYRRLSLETGSMEMYAAARALYASAGFLTCAPFAGYGPSPHSAYMTLALDPAVGSPPRR